MKESRGKIELDLAWGSKFPLGVVHDVEEDFKYIDELIFKKPQFCFLNQIVNLFRIYGKYYCLSFCVDSIDIYAVFVPYTTNNFDSILCAGYFQPLEEKNCVATKKISGSSHVDNIGNELVLRYMAKLVASESFWRNESSGMSRRLNLIKRIKECM